MKSNPLISVIIPFYNGERYVAQAIESALSQTYKNTEIIVIDDGSKDESLLALNPYLDRIKLVKQNNGDVSSARNKGAMVAEGEIIAFLDQDDYWDENKLQRQVNLFLKYPEIDLVYCELIKIYENGSTGVQNDKIGLSKRAKGKDYFIELAKKNLLMPSAVAVKKESFINAGMFDTNFKTCGDYEMWLRMASKGMKFLYDDYLGVFYRIHSSNESKKIDKMNEDRFKALETVFSYEWLSDKHRKYRDIAFSVAYKEAGYSLFSSKRYLESKTELIKAIKLNCRIVDCKLLSRLIRAKIKS